MFSRRAVGAALAAVTLAVVHQGCSSTPGDARVSTDGGAACAAPEGGGGGGGDGGGGGVADGGAAVCCTEFQAGAEVDDRIGGSAQSKVAVQAVSDLAAVASAAIDELAAACLSIAQSLDASAADQAAAAAGADNNARMRAWCSLASKTIGVAKAAAGTLTLSLVPPVCEMSTSAKLDCQARCAGGVKCDDKANPPKCTGGSLVIACKGDCTPSGGNSSVSCKGTCTGACAGSCMSAGGADCVGRCEGICLAKAGVGNGTGAQADGSCNGTCKGTCAAMPPGATCDGQCNGGCNAVCRGSSTASVKCDGTCNGDYQPISCIGGKLEGGCAPDAKCDANCNTLVHATAMPCTPSALKLAFAGTANAPVAGKLADALSTYLPKVLELKARFAVIADGALGGNIATVTDIKPACIPPVVAAAARGIADVGDTVSASAAVLASVGL